MNKRALIKKIVAKLADELETYFRAAQFSRAEATHESSKAENKYDTRGLEASYLARGQSKQAAEIKSAIAAFEELPAKKIRRGRRNRPRRAGGIGTRRRATVFISSARARAAPKCCTTNAKFSSSPRNRHWARNSSRRNPAKAFNSF